MPFPFLVVVFFMILAKFASRNKLLQEKLANYVAAKKVFDDLIMKYEVFTAKEKSVAEAAKLVGLKVPVDRRSS